VLSPKTLSGLCTGADPGFAVGRHQALKGRAPKAQGSRRPKRQWRWAGHGEEVSLRTGGRVWRGGMPSSENFSKKKFKMASFAAV